MSRKTRKNLLFIHVDQQRYDCLGFTGNPLIRTPNLDRLAGGGVQFTKAYTPCPLCCPARQTLLTSKMPHVHGGHWNYAICSDIKGLGPDEFPHWPGVLKDAGYRMSYIGKWHVDPERDPTCFGYDEFLSEAAYDAAALKPYYHDMYKEEPEVPADYFCRGLYDTTPLDEAPTHRMAKQAIEFIRENRDSDAPWHVRLDYAEPHLPSYPVEAFLKLYPRESIEPWGNFPDDFHDKPGIQKKQLENWGIADWSWQEWSSYISLYFAMISQIDDAIGKLLNYLEEAGEIDDTLIIYTSDHGDAAGSHGMMDKHYVMYEEEVHVPLIIHHPESIPAGQAEGFTLHAMDLGPTILELLDLEVPDSFSGKSLVPMLRDPGSRIRDHIISEYNGQQFGLYTQRMIRDERYTYVWNPTDIDEFYDHEADSYQLENLIDAEDYQQQIRILREQLYQDFASSGDMMVRNAWAAYQLNGRLMG